MPNQTPELVDQLVISYIESEFKKLNTKSKMTIENLHGGKPWVADTNHWNYLAATLATEVRGYNLFDSTASWFYASKLNYQHLGFYVITSWNLLIFVHCASSDIIYRK